MTDPGNEMLAKSAGLSDEDQDVLELLRLSRERKDMDITEAVNRERARYRLEDSKMSNAVILGQEAIALYKVMRKAGKVIREAGQLITPQLLSTESEFVGDSYVSAGYIFRAEEDIPGRRKRVLQSLRIHRQVQDRDTGVAVSRPLYFVYHLHHEAQPVPARLDGYTAILYPHIINITDEEQLLEPIVLIKLAREELVS